MELAKLKGWLPIVVSAGGVVVELAKLKGWLPIVVSAGVKLGWFERAEIEALSICTGLGTLVVMLLCFTGLALVIPRGLLPVGGRAAALHF